MTCLSKVSWYDCSCGAWQRHREGEEASGQPGRWHREGPDSFMLGESDLRVEAREPGWAV